MFANRVLGENAKSFTKLNAQWPTAAALNRGCLNNCGPNHCSLEKPIGARPTIPNDASQSSSCSEREVLYVFALSLSLSSPIEADTPSPSSFPFVSCVSLEALIPHRSIPHLQNKFRFSLENAATVPSPELGLVPGAGRKGRG